MSDEAPLEHEKAKRKRADRSEKLKERAGTSETVVKLCLRKSLQAANNKNAFIRAVDERVNNCSIRLKFASLSLMSIIKEASNGIDDVLDITLPDVCDETFFRQLLLGTEEADPVIEQYFQDNPHMLPQQQRHYYDRNIYSFASKKYMTNFRNSLFMTFQNRIKSFAKTFVRVHGIDDRYKALMLYKIHGWTLSESLSTFEGFPAVEDEIRKHRLILGLGDGLKLTEKQLKSKDMSLKILRYFIHLNKFQETHRGKTFNIVPIARYGRSFITLDTFGLYGILKDIGFVNVNWVTFDANRQKYWRDAMAVDRFQGASNTFTGTIDTDGVSVCIHYVRPKADSDKDNKTKPKLTEDDRVLGGDPGRTNMICLVEILPNGEMRVYNLTRAQYYKHSGIFKARKKTNTWSRKIRTELQQLSSASSKGMSIDSHSVFLGVFTNTFDALHKEYSKRRWARQRLRLYGGKKRTIDEFMNKIEADEPEKRVVVAYGAAKFAPGGKGELSVPTTALFKAFAVRFLTCLVDEHRSTRVFNKDDSVLYDVKKRDKVTSRVKDVRGLKWSETTKMFVNRDVNAAINIRRIFLAYQRPMMLRHHPEALPRFTKMIRQ